MAPTCSSTGLTEGAHCETCGLVLKAQEVVSKTAHTPITVPAVDATCTSTGLTAGSKCSVCDATLVEQTETPLKAHSYDNEQDADCNVCGFERDVACQHTNTIVVPGKAASCTATGLTEGKVCANEKCGAIIVAQEVIPALGHTWGEWEITTAPTYETEDVKTRTCSVCGETETGVVDKLVRTHDIYFIGTFNEWKPENLTEEYRLAESEDKATWTGTLVVMETAKLKLYNKANGAWIGATDLELTAGTYHFTYTVATDTYTYVKEGAEPETPAEPEE